MQLRHLDTLFFLFKRFSPFSLSVYMLSIDIWIASEVGLNLEYLGLRGSDSHLQA